MSFTEVIRGFVLLWLLTLAASGVAIRPDASDAFFASTNISRFKITIAPADVVKLQREPHAYVHAVVLIDDRFQFADAAVHIKGGAGSLRPFNDKPALTISFSKYEETKFMGLRKIHLNNSVQDPSYMTENLCGRLFREAGVPAPRVTNARVWLNGRDLGLFVLIEGFTKDFLKRWFTDTSGNLYDGGFVQEITERKEAVNGADPKNQSDLKVLADAAREADPVKRFERMDKVLDVDRFISFVVMELMTGHWDGYTVNRNNYRMYHDPTTDKIVFFPHGMDQMFSSQYILRQPPLNGLVASGLMSTPEGQRRYRERIGVLYTKAFKLEAITNQVNDIEARCRPALVEYNQGFAREFAGQAAGVRERVRAMDAHLRRQFDMPEPVPLKFDPQGRAKLVLPWEPKIDSGEPKLDRAIEPAKEGERSIFHINAGGSAVASWRARLVIPAGKYLLTGSVRTEGVVAQKDEVGTGVGLRISGMNRANKLAGTAAWTTLEFPFEATDLSTEVELICELRARKGQAWFDGESFKLLRK